MNLIHETAIIDPSAELDSSVSVGPWSVIGPKVRVDKDTWIGPHVVLNGPTRIGKNNRIFQFASVGEIPQDKKFFNEEAYLEIGDNNTIRECCTINRGTEAGGGVTRIGNDNWIMAYVHIAHDCIIGNNTIFANNASLAGHVIIEDHVNLGGFSGVHQFCRVGSYSFIAKATYVTKDVLPYMMIAGHDAAASGLNLVGLKRHNFTEQSVDLLKQAYKIIYRKGLTVKHAVEELLQLERSPELQSLISGLQESTRGIVR